jgi:copper(I)-binding protein
MKHLVFLAVILLMVLAGACASAPSASSGAGITASDVWARAAATGNSAAYMILRNNGAAADRLIKAESDVAGTVELHKTTMEGGMMKMAPVDGIEIPAQGQAELKPGGLHVMLIGLKRELKAGEKFKLKLHFEKAGVQESEAEVRK